MTFRDLFEYAAAQPGVVAFFLLIIPALVFLLNLWVGETAEAIWRWRYLYAGLVYAACIPGMFAVTLAIYLFLFERQSIWDVSLVLQVLPILTMVATLVLIRRKLPFQYIPGFGRLSSFLTLIAGLIGVLWFVDRLRLVAFTYVPFSYVLIGFVALLLIIRFAWSRIF
ncbi:hypothetical protein [Fibrella forsythiae]|uniref:Uncharacterized protein n=1 Tax=Fibrella forsythiae TaxID=2817061 RepID=A0ABS3JPX9_9BACT|nr:hypothetical protein [Fibrella forsythiae]MBO0952060.1 hypothetical protein [Fibrella forsythiae]